MAHLSLRIQQSSRSLTNVVLGWESMNEPSQSWIGNSNLSVIPQEQHLRKGTCPTPFQAMVTAAGLAQEIQVWDFGTTGPSKKGTTIVDPKGVSVWLKDPDMDRKYGFTRSSEWQLGQCLWEQHGVWNSSRVELLQPRYFMLDLEKDENQTAGFLRLFWMEHFRRFKSSIRSTHSSSIIFCQPPVLKIPPVFTQEDKMDSQIVYAPHYV